MKKILVSMLAVAAMVACSNEHTLVEAPMSDAIGFDTFVENSTRANDVTTETIEDFGFGVYASVTNTAGQSGLILTNEEVSYDGFWGYSNTQYWVAGNDYNFTAIAPYQAGEDATWTYAPKDGKMAQHGVISFNNAAAVANQDLVFASASRKVTEAYTSTPEAVKFTFNHMLSRVRFSFANGFQSAGNIELAVSNVHITDAYANGTLAVENGAPVAAWTNLADKDLDVVFGDAAAVITEGKKQSTEHFYLIPNAAVTAYKVTFDVTLFQAGVEIATYPHTVELKCAMNRGVSYDIKTTLTEKNTSDEEIYPIEFTVTEVEDWANYTEVALEAKTVATTQELVDAIAEGGDIRLISDITLSGSELRVAEDKEVNLDLNGNTLTVAALDPIDNYGKMTIANGKVAAGNTDATRRCIYNHGEMVIENMEFVQIFDERGAAINNEGKMTINNTTVDAVRYAVWSSGANAETIINSGTFSNETDMNLPVYAVVAYEGAKMTINGGTFISDHGCVCACDGSQVLINGGTFTCTSEYSAGSDWVFAGGDGDNAMNNDGSLIKYDESECVINGNILNNGCVVAF